MLSGKYRVIKEVYVFDCTYGQLKIGEGVIFYIKDNGFTGYTDNFSFPSALLDGCEDCIKRIFE